MITSKHTSLCFLVILCMPILSFGIINGRSTTTFCPEIEKQALLTFKKSLNNPSNPLLSSWHLKTLNCCNWEGVVCSNSTGHVHHLHLPSQSLQGKLNLSTLLNLKHLSYLDLSQNKFEGTIPSLIGSFQNLEYLNLSHAGFHGKIPQTMGNLSNLHTLILEGSGLHVDGIEWLSGLVRLNNLNMNFVDLKKGINWLEIINNLPYLVELRLRSCRLEFLSPLPHFNLTSLTFLDLSWNNLSSSIPDWIYLCKDLKFLFLGNNQLSGEIPREIATLCRIQTLDLSANKLEGEIIDAFGNMSDCFLGSLRTLKLRQNLLSGHLTDQFGEFKNLMYLDLTKNSISGPIPNSLGKLSRLSRLWLGFNKLSGEFPVSIGQLSKLTSLVIGRNMLEGVVNETHFANLTNLKYLFASGNNLALNVSPNWVSPFQLVEIGLGSWNLGAGPKIPSWIHHLQDSLQVLDLSDAGLSGDVPNWVWDVSVLNLSHNHFHGEIPDFKPWGNRLVFPYYRWMYLSSNQFSGSLPQVSYDTVEMDLSNNSLSGTLSHFLCDATNDTYGLKILHLANNVISGDIPDCWMKWSSLKYLNLGNNMMVGRIPYSIGFLANLLSLNLHGNNFAGEIPLSMQNCTKLVKIDVAGNDLSGKIPTWIGTSFSNLMILILHSNKFSGEIPPTICHLKALQILDLSSNYFSGAIPTCVHNFTAMATRSGFEGYVASKIVYSLVFDAFIESVLVDAKGQILQYNTFLVLVTSINFSNNNLSGEIPEEVTNLVELKFLNLSRNHLRGSIPRRVGDMRQLESLDLSRNSLRGEIPISITRISSLSYLNLSYNLLEGMVPQGTQILSMDASSFVGNDLCGPPLPCNCSNSCDEDSQPLYEDEEGDYGYWCYVLVLIGYAVGFIGVCAVLVLNKPWREAYFGWLELVWDNICVYTTINWRRLKGSFRR